jgi:Putative auto-transporter adhesin, head GIN domain
MKKYILFIAVITLATSCYNGKRGSGNIITEKRNVSGFTMVNASSSIDIDVQQGAETSVIVEADDNLIKYIETKVEGNELKIRYKNIHIRHNATIKVHIISPQFDGFISSASAEIKGKNTITSASKIKLEASSSANINIEVDAPTVDVKASSSAEITVGGRTKDVVVDASSSASVALNKLQAETAIANASSSADVSIFASVKINAKANSSGDITYTGGATDVVKSENSSGTVTKQ